MKYARAIVVLVVAMVALLLLKLLLFFFELKPPLYGRTMPAFFSAITVYP